MPYFLYSPPESWLVKPLEGANSFTKEDGLTLHINWASVCLAYLNPPRHYLRWCLDTIQHISYENTKLCFTVMKDNNNSGECFYGTQYTIYRPLSWGTHLDFFPLPINVTKLKLEGEIVWFLFVQRLLITITVYWIQET